MPVLGLNFPARRRGTRGRAGIYLSSAVLALAVAEWDQQGVRVRCRADPLRGGDDIGKMLGVQIAALKAKKLDAELVLSPDFYTLALIERPRVDDAELKEAVRWRMQEILDFPAEEATLDVFPMPASATRGRESVFVAAMHRDRLKVLVAEIFDAGVTIDSVDVIELALRNVVAVLYPGAARGIGLLRLTAHSGQMNVTRGHELFLSRRLTHVPQSWDDGSWAGFREQLLLQVQRSIDYHESVLGQPPIEALAVAVSEGWQEQVVEYLAGMLPMPVHRLTEKLGRTCGLRVFNPDPEKIDWEAPSDMQIRAVNAAIPAVGGALRKVALVETGTAMGDAGVGW